MLIGRCGAMGGLARSKTPGGTAAGMDEFQSTLRRLIRANGSDAILEKEKCEFSQLFCARSGVGDGPETGCMARRAKLSGATTQQGGLEQMRERATPTKWTLLERCAGSRITKKIESADLDGRRTKGAAKVWRGCRVGLDRNALNNGDSAVSGKRRTRYA